tara:strand:- start:870 stop:1262 length:393 start_codon:yes stop_codon:yes gene_type:complete
MNLTRLKLVELIKEELSLLGALNPEENFIRKYGIVLTDDDGEMPVSDAFRSGAEVQELESEDIDQVAEAKKKKEKKKRKLTKIQIIKRDKRAKKIMKSTKKEYGKERGEDIAYAIATNQVKGKKRKRKLA